MLYMYSALLILFILIGCSVTRSAWIKNPKNQGARNKKLRIISKSKENHTASKLKSSPHQTYRHEKENASMFKRKRADNQRMNKRIERQREKNIMK